MSHPLPPFLLFCSNPPSRRYRGSTIPSKCKPRRMNLYHHDAITNLLHKKERRYFCQMRFAYQGNLAPAWSYKMLSHQSLHSRIGDPPSDRPAILFCDNNPVGSTDNGMGIHVYIQVLKNKSRKMIEYLGKQNISIAVKLFHS